MSFIFPSNSCYTQNPSEQNKRKVLLLLGALAPFLIYIGSSTYPVPETAADEVVAKPPSSTFGWIWALNVLTLVAVGWYSAITVPEISTAAVMTSLVIAYSVVAYVWLYHYDNASKTGEKNSYQRAVWDLAAATGLAVAILVFVASRAVHDNTFPAISKLIVLGTVLLLTWTGFATQIGIQDAQIMAS